MFSLCTLFLCTKTSMWTSVQFVYPVSLYQDLYLGLCSVCVSCFSIPRLAFGPKLSLCILFLCTKTCIWTSVQFVYRVSLYQDLHLDLSSVCVLCFSVPRLACRTLFSLCTLFLCAKASMWTSVQFCFSVPRLLYRTLFSLCTVSLYPSALLPLWPQHSYLPAAHKLIVCVNSQIV